MIKGLIVAQGSHDGISVVTINIPFACNQTHVLHLLNETMVKLFDNETLFSLPIISEDLCVN